MQILLDENGYVNSYSFYGGTFENGHEVDNPEDEQEFIENYASYYYEDGKLVKDEEKAQADALEKRRNEIRQHRDEICFPVINRGEMWYSILTEEQKEELKAWYTAWLDAPETLVEPEMPTWLKG